MALAVPYAEVQFDPAALQALKDTAERKLYELMQSRGFATGERAVTLKAIRPNDDLSLTHGTDQNEWNVPAGTANTDTTYINAATIGGNKFLVFTGVVLRGAFTRLPIITVRFKTGPSGQNTIAEYDLQGGSEYEHKVWFFDDPPIYKPDDRITVELENAVTYVASQYQLPFKGYTAEPSGTTEM
jgi:hypothetical protein